jgi:hypothetical protein
LTRSPMSLISKTLVRLAFAAIVPATHPAE